MLMNISFKKRTLLILSAVLFRQKVQSRFIKLEATTPDDTIAEVNMNEIGVIVTPWWVTSLKGMHWRLFLDESDAGLFFSKPNESFTVIY